MCIRDRAKQIKTNFAVPHASFNEDCDWLPEAHEIYFRRFRQQAPEVQQRADFIMPWLEDADTPDWSSCISYQRSKNIAKEVLPQVIEWAMPDESPAKAIALQFVEKDLEGWQGARATMPGLMAQEGKNYAAQMLSLIHI